MLTRSCSLAYRATVVTLFLSSLVFTDGVSAADRLTGLHSAQVMSQSMPWIAQEAGLFKKYDLDFRLVFIPSSPVATAATLNGDAEIGVTGAIGNVRAYVQGFTDLVFIGGIKNILTHSILGKPDIKRPEDLKRKKGRRRAIRRQHPLFHHPGPQEIRHGCQQGHSDDTNRRRPGDGGGSFERQYRCGGAW